MIKIVRIFISLLIVLSTVFISIPVYAADIDVGSEASNRDTTAVSGQTIILKDNPANATGTILKVDVWANTNITGLKVGMFYLISGTTYKCRSAATIGSVTAGSKYTFDVNLAVETGDLLGFYFSGGSLESSTSGAGVYFYGGADYVTVNSQSGYGSASNRTDSIYGYAITTTAPTITTQAASDVSYTTATGNGNITNTGDENPSTRGICYSSVNNPPTTSDSKVEETGGSFSTGAFTESLTSLSQGTHYYARAYATNSAGTSYGDTVEFTTLTQSPIVTTQAASDIEMDEDGVTSGVFNGNLTNLGEDTDVDVSFMYGTTSACADDETTPVNVDATGVFYNDTEFPTDWIPGATYYYKAKATNTHGTSYGSVQSIVFTMPTITTQAATYTSPGAATADLNGNISNMGVATGCYAYFEYGTSTSYGSSTTPQTFTIADDVEDTISGFLHNVTVHYRLVIEVGETTVNGNDETFLIAPPAISGALWYQPNTIVTNTSFDGIADAGSSDTVLIDAELTQDNDYWNYALLTITDTTDDLAPKGETAVITDFIAASNELQFAALTAALEAGDTYTVEFGTLTDRAGNEDGIITWGVNPDGITVSIGPVSGGASGLVAPNPNGRHYDIAPPIGGEEYVVPNATPDTPLNPIMDAISTVMSISGSPFTVPVQILWIILATCVILACMVISMRYLPNQLIGSIVCIGLSILFWKLHVYPFAMVIFICFVCAAILIWERKPSV